MANLSPWPRRLTTMGRSRPVLPLVCGTTWRLQGTDVGWSPTQGSCQEAHSDRNYRVPDIGVTCAPPSGRQIVPDPLILIEILSPSNEAETWANVWTYLTIPTVMEVLVVNSTLMEAELLRRNADSTWPEVPQRLGPDDALELNSIGFSVSMAALYRTTTLATPGGKPP